MRGIILGVVLASASCSTAKPDQRPDDVKSSSSSALEAAPNGHTTGKQVVRGGESFSLDGGVQVQVAKIVFDNHPCPAGQECLGSGVIKGVEFKVARGTASQGASVLAGKSQVVDGVKLEVHSVTDGPQAEITASLPVGASTSAPSTGGSGAADAPPAAAN